MVRAMPGESPGQRDWNVLLTPPTESYDEMIAASRARHRRRMRRRAWTWFAYAVLGAVFIGWLSLFPWALNVPVQWLGLVAWLVACPLSLWITVILLNRAERLVIPSTERELELEERS